LIDRLWDEIESDFQAVYGIADPLSLGARRFKLLLSQLPPDSMTVRTLAAEREESGDPAWWVTEFDKARERGEVRRISPEQLIGLVKP